MLGNCSLPIFAFDWIMFIYHRVWFWCFSFSYSISIFKWWIPITGWQIVHAWHRPMLKIFNVSDCQADVWSTSPLPLTPPVSVAARPMSFPLFLYDAWFGWPFLDWILWSRSSTHRKNPECGDDTGKFCKHHTKTCLVLLDWHGHGSFYAFYVPFPVHFHREERNVDLVLRRLPSRRQRSLGLNRLLHHRPGSQTKARKRTDFFDAKRLCTKLIKITKWNQMQKCKRFLKEICSVLCRPAWCGKQCTSAPSRHPIKSFFHFWMQPLRA